MKTQLTTARAVQNQTLRVLTKPVAAFYAAVASVASGVRGARQQVLKDRGLRQALTRSDNGTVVNAARFCVQANLQAREGSQARLRLIFFDSRQHFSNLTVDRSRCATYSLSMSDCGTGSSRPRGERSRLCLVLALVLLSAFLELKVDCSSCRSLTFADWKPAALDSSEVSSETAEVIFVMVLP